MTVASADPQGLNNYRLASRMRKVIRAEAGDTIVEFAMSSIILFTLIIGVMTICFALYSYNITAEVAREGCRYAIVRGSACTSSLPRAPPRRQISLPMSKAWAFRASIQHR